MKNIVAGIIAIILGLIVITFPLFGVVGAAVLFSFSLIILSVWFLAQGIAELDISVIKGLLYTILGIITLIFAIGIVFNPELFSFVIAFILYLAGIFLIIAGFLALIGRKETNTGIWPGIVGIILGIIYIILGSFAIEPLYLGLLIGIWLIVTGIFKILE